MSAKSLAKSLLPPLLASALRDLRDRAFGPDRRPRWVSFPEGWRKQQDQAGRGRDLETVRDRYRVTWHSVAGCPARSRAARRRLHSLDSPRSPATLTLPWRC